MEYIANIANKTGIAGLVKKAVGFIGVVVVAGVAAGCVTTGEPPKTVFVPDRTPWHKAEEEKLGGCVNLDTPKWHKNTTTVTERAIKKNQACTRKMTGNTPDNYEVIQEPKHGKLELTTNNGKTPLEIKYTPDKDYIGIDEYTIKIHSTSMYGGKATGSQKTILYIGDFQYGNKFSL